MEKLTIYRLNNCDLSDEGIKKVINENYSPDEISLKDSSKTRLYLIPAKPKTPDWLDYLVPLLKKPVELKTSTSGGVLFVHLVEDPNVLYAITWGAGHFLLKPAAIQRNFGIRCALNLMSADKPNSSKWDPERLKSITAKRIGPNTYIYQGQFAKEATLDSFPFSIDADQLRSITGMPVKAEDWGKSISGGISLHIKAPEKPADIVKVCKKVDLIYSGVDYKNSFSWIDNFKPIDDDETISELNNEVVERIKLNNLDGLTLAVPTLVQFENIEKYGYQHNGKIKEIEEPSLDNFRQYLSGEGILTTLTKDHLYEEIDLKTWDASGDENHAWKTGSCITGDFVHNNKTYIIDEGGYYEIDKDYLDSLNRYVDGIKKCQPALPPATKEMKTEDDYVVKLPQKLGGDAILLHKMTIRRPGSTAIEICDVALKEKKYIHVKKGTCSSSLSHLFSQALVSGELLLMDGEFRKMVKDKVDEQAKEDKDSYKWIYDAKFEPTDQEIVMAIMTGCKEKEVSKLLPFFSKVNLKMRCDDLKRRGYKYSIAQITRAE